MKPNPCFSNGGNFFSEDLQKSPKLNLNRMFLGNITKAEHKTRICLAEFEVFITLGKKNPGPFGHIPTFKLFYYFILFTPTKQSLLMKPGAICPEKGRFLLTKK